MAVFSRRRLAAGVVRLLHTQPTQQADILRSLAAYLVVHKQTKQLDLLLKDIARELEASEKTSTAEVLSAFALTDATRAYIKQFIQQKTGAQTIALEENVDTSLLSGIIIRTATSELDISARRALTQLASLNSGGNS